MKIVTIDSHELVKSAAQYTAFILLAALRASKDVFLLLSAGSWVKVYSSLVTILPSIDMSMLTFGLVDERFVPKRHKDSNEQQISESKLIQSFVGYGAKYIPTVQDINVDPKASAQTADVIYKQVFSRNPYFILTLGLGTDGHTAGILPSSSEQLFNSRFADEKLLVYYETISDETQNPHRQRFTISPSCILKADEVIVYAAGAEKRPIIDQLVHTSAPIHTFPAGILRAISDKVTIYTDTV